MEESRCVLSEGLNKVLLLGGLAADPELRYTQSGQAVLNLRVATTERYKDRDGEWKDRTEYHSVTVWDKRGEALAKILSKGSSVFIEGSLRTSSYDDREGNKRYRTDVIARNVILAGNKRRDGEDAPTGGAASRNTATRSTNRDTPPADPLPDYGDDGSEIPF